jgi:hypothetical protein
VQHVFEVLGPARFTEYAVDDNRDCTGHRVSRDLDATWLESTQDTRREQSTAEVRIDANAENGARVSLHAASAGEFGTVYITKECTVMVKHHRDIDTDEL